MAGFYPWLNQKMSNFLGDFKEEREPAEGPSPSRALCRILFVLALITGFSLLLVYHFMESPDVRVEQIYLRGKHRNFAVHSLNRSTNSNSKSPNLVVCPCRNISVSWRDFVSFYILTENSPQWNISWYSPSENKSPRIYVPTLTEANSTTLLKDYIVKDPIPLTAERFCDHGIMWPMFNEATKAEFSTHWNICLWMASTLLPVSTGNRTYFEDKTNSTQFLASPVLLNRELLYMLVAQRARESILRGLKDLDMMNFASQTLAKSYTGFADILIKTLDRFEMEEWESYYYGARALASNLYSKVTFGDQQPSVVFLYNEITNESIFLHPKIDWMKYYNTCKPLYCEETKPMSLPWQVYRAFGLLGGVATVVIGLVTALLWPATGILLSWYSSRSSHSDGDPEQPQATLLSNPGGSLSPAPLSHVPVASVVSTIRSASFHRRTSQTH